MYKNCIKLLLTTLGLLLFTGCQPNSDNGAPTKLAVLDIQQILQQSLWVKSLNDQINQQLDPLRDAIKARQQALEAQAKKLEDPSLEKTQLEKLRANFLVEEKKLFEDAVALQKQTIDKENDSLKRLYEKLDYSIAEYNQQHNYQVILKKSAVVYENKGMNVTDKIERLFNEDNNP